MVKITAIYEGDLRCKATHEPSANTLLTDAPKDNQGKGEAFSPTDLIATALGTCILSVMGIAARKLNVDITGARISVEKEMIAAPTRRIGKLTTHVHMPNVDLAHRQKFEEAAHTCPVKQSLHPDIAIEITFDWA